MKIRNTLKGEFSDAALAELVRWAAKQAGVAISEIDTVQAAKSKGAWSSRVTKWPAAGFSLKRNPGSIRFRIGPAAQFPIVSKSGIKVSDRWEAAVFVSVMLLRQIGRRLRPGGDVSLVTGRKALARFREQREALLKRWTETKPVDKGAEATAAVERLQRLVTKWTRTLVTAGTKLAGYQKELAKAREAEREFARPRRQKASTPEPAGRGEREFDLHSESEEIDEPV